MPLSHFANRLLRSHLICLPVLFATLQAQAVYQQVHSFGRSADSGAYPAAAPLVGFDGRLYGSTARGGLNGVGTIFRTEMDGGDFTVLHSFRGTDGMGPVGDLVQDEAGFLYGVAGGGSVSTNGVVFKIHVDGSGFAVIKDFAADGSEGWEPGGGLMRASNGLLYGTTYGGGAFDSGTVYTVNTDGTGFEILREFGDLQDHGLNPRSTLIEGTDGFLYGTTRNGGTTGGGTVFRMTKFGLGFEVLKSFVPSTEGEQPLSGVIEGQDGRLYGTLASKGAGDGGAAYAINADGTGFTVLHSFVAGDIWAPTAGICQTTDGMLYTIASSGGISGKGAVVQFGPDGTGYAKVREFGTPIDQPNLGVSSLVEAPDGRLYFTTFLGGAHGDGTLVRMLKNGNELRIIKSFFSSGSEAILPRGDLAVGVDGFLYGTSPSGGSASKGTVFRLQPDGSAYAILCSLGQTPDDAATPSAGILLASDGKLYGTAFQGGTSGQGALFRLGVDGTGYAVVRSFRGAPTDGAEPISRLIEGADGFLYGVTSSGGSANRGTIFRIRKDGTGYAVLRSFLGAAADGATPFAELLQAQDGILYGVTYSGGSGDGGTAFRLNPDGSGYSVLRSFTGASQTPANPYGGLIEGSDGRLYGTSLTGGGGGGTVFSLAKDGSDLRVLVVLPKPDGGGTSPTARLLEDPTGRLWGTCWKGGLSGAGTIFSLNRDGAEYEVVHQFAGSPSDGSGPVAGLSIDADGVLYGTAMNGGDLNRGIVFRVWPRSAFRIEAIAYQAGGPAIVQIKAPPGWLCHLESTPAVQPSAWSEVASGHADANGNISLSDPASSDQSIRFYRARATP